MTEPSTSEHPDDALLIDFLTGHVSPSELRRVHERLESDPAFARRAGRIGGLLKVLATYEAPAPSDALLARTVAAAESAKKTAALLDREAGMARPVTVPSFSLKELGAMAALLFLVGTILLPSFYRAHQLAQDNACVARAGEIGNALVLYANTHGGSLPALGAPDAAWLADCGERRRLSNSRNLWVLVRDECALPIDFQCPAGETRALNIEQASALGDFPSRDFISYSYHNAVNATGLRLNAPYAAAKAILADRTPVFEGGRFNPDRVNSRNSPNHDQRGQAVLYLDMHAVFAHGGEVGVDGDNIWLVRGVHSYQGHEVPADEHDSFLLPSFVESGR